MSRTADVEWLHDERSKLISETNDLRAQLATVTAERDEARKLLDSYGPSLDSLRATARSEGWRAGVADSLAAVGREQLGPCLDLDDDTDRAYRAALEDCTRALNSLTETKGKEP